jgi:hypothetical protein
MTAAWLDPYTMNAYCTNMRYEPCEEQERLGWDPTVYGPGVAYLQWAKLFLDYEGEGASWTGSQVLKEEIKERAEAEHVGHVRPSFTGLPSLSWEAPVVGSVDDTALRWGEAPDFILGGEEYIRTYPFAPDATYPVPIGNVNDDAFQSSAPMGGRVFPRGTLKYMGSRTLSSLYIPGIAGSVGTARHRKQFIFHFRPTDWNYRWRSADQQVLRMVDVNGNLYLQHPYSTFTGVV